MLRSKLRLTCLAMSAVLCGAFTPVSAYELRAVLTDTGNGGRGIGWGHTVSLSDQHLLVSDSSGVVSAYFRADAQQPWQFNQVLERFGTLMSIDSQGQWLALSSYGNGVWLYRWEAETKRWERAQRFADQTGAVAFAGESLLIGNGLYQRDDSGSWQLVHRTALPKPFFWDDQGLYLVGQSAEDGRLKYEYAPEGWDRALVLGVYDGVAELRGLSTSGDSLVYAENRPEAYVRADRVQALFDSDRRYYSEYAPAFSVARVDAGEHLALLSGAADHFAAVGPNAQQPAVLLDTRHPMTPLKSIERLALYDADFNERELLLSPAPALEAGGGGWLHNSAEVSYYRAEQYLEPAQRLRAPVGATEAYFSAVLSADQDRVVALEAGDLNAHADGVVLKTYQINAEGVSELGRQVLFEQAAAGPARRVSQSQLEGDTLLLASHLVDAEGRQTQALIERYELNADGLWQRDAAASLGPLSGQANRVDAFVLAEDLLYVSAAASETAPSTLLVYQWDNGQWQPRAEREGLGFEQAAVMPNGVVLSNSTRLLVVQWREQALSVSEPYVVAHRNLVYHAGQLLLAESDNNRVGVYQWADERQWLRLGEISPPEPVSQWGTALSVRGKNLALSGLDQSGQAKLWLLRQQDDEPRAYALHATLDQPASADESFGSGLHWSHNQVLASAPSVSHQWGEQAGALYLIGDLPLSLNHSPEIQPISLASVEIGQVGRYPIEVTDWDGESVSLSLADAPDWVSLEGRELRLAPVAGSVGALAFRLIASDGRTSTEQALSVQVLESTDADKTTTPNSGGLAGSSGGGGIVVWVLSLLGIAYAHRQR